MKLVSIVLGLIQIVSGQMQPEGEIDVSCWATDTCEVPHNCRGFVGNVMSNCGNEPGNACPSRIIRPGYPYDVHPDFPRLPQYSLPQWIRDVKCGDVFKVQTERAGEELYVKIADYVLSPFLASESRPATLEVAHAGFHRVCPVACVEEGVGGECQEFLAQCEAGTHTFTKESSETVSAFPCNWNSKVQTPAICGNFTEAVVTRGTMYKESDGMGVLVGSDAVSVEVPLALLAAAMAIAA